MLHIPPCTTPPYGYIETVLELSHAVREPFESAIEHIEREDYTRDGWGDARQTVYWAATGAITQNGPRGRIEAAPNRALIDVAEKALARCVRNLRS